MTTARVRSATALLTALFLLAALLVTVLPAQPSRASTGPGDLPTTVVVPGSSFAVIKPGAPNRYHPYSDPVWFPFRSSVRVGCVYSNCAGPYHGYWAIDFGGTLDEPVYAAGAGVFHVGSLDHSCPASGVTAGTWAWIDHGAAGITRYHHLNRILAKEGQLVTPATEIGTMGTNGNIAPCKVAYLHMEWHSMDRNVVRLPIPAMWACEGSSKVSYPSALGYTAWNSVPNNQVHTPVLTGSCLPESWGLTPSQPSMTLTRGTKAAVVTPSARPAGADKWRHKLEEYFPSLGKYLLLSYGDHAPTTASTTLSGLDSGRTYRVSVAFHNASGWSTWAPAGTVIPR